MRRRRPPRISAEDYRGGVRIFFTMCTFQRRPLFGCCEFTHAVIEILLRTAKEFDVEITAHCFMPDHVHMLVEGRSETADQTKFASVFRQRTGYAYRRTRKDRLWQEGYFDRSLRRCEQTIDVVAYIVGNPVRARLCEAPEQYPFTGSSRYRIEDLADAVQWRP
jgi:putative transposase